MSEDTDIVKDMMKNGRYFDAAKSWYQTLYIGPIAERSFFLLVAVVSLLIAMFAFSAWMDLLPITSRPGLILRSDRIDDVAIEPIPIGGHGTSINTEMRDFFIRHYVIARESYESQKYDEWVAFLNAHSDAPTWATYNAQYGKNNPQSPAALLGTQGKRVVTITSFSVKESVEPKVATVHFTTELEGNSSTSKTRWTAVLQYYYSDLVVQNVTDPETGDEKVITQDPQFQVVNYVLSQTP